jgi:hypothetical protein
MPPHEASHLSSSLSGSCDLDAGRHGACTFMLMPRPRPVLLWITSGSDAMGGLRARLYPSGQGHAVHAHPSCHDVRNAAVGSPGSATGPSHGDCSPSPRVSCSGFCAHYSVSLLAQPRRIDRKSSAQSISSSEPASPRTLNTSMSHI